MLVHRFPVVGPDASVDYKYTCIVLKGSESGSREDLSREIFEGNISKAPSDRKASVQMVLCYWWIVYKIAITKCRLAEKYIHQDISESCNSLRVLYRVVVLGAKRDALKRHDRQTHLHMMGTCETGTPMGALAQNC